MLAARRSGALLGRTLSAAQLRSGMQEPARQAVWMSGEATSTSSSAAPAPEVDMTAAAAAAAAAARTAAAEAAPPAWAAHSGVTTLDCLPMPAWIVAAAKPKRPAVGLAEAVKTVQSLARAKFDESIELSMCLGIDPRRGDQMVRGAATLPHGTGRSVRVCVFAKDDEAQQARDAGAEVVGDEDLIALILESGGGGLTFDKAMATPEMMPKLSKIARILGPRGLMPNPKMGTVTSNVAAAVKTMKQGRVEFRADKGGVVHAGVGKCSFEGRALQENIGAFAAAILAARPKGVKGGTISGYLISASLCSSMGPGIPLNVAALVAAAQAARKAE
ncbi:50S ribosomal L1 [Micractinium conductrix]|uniref:Ribosomal protein n=1 Tax=Micractinium conductrix TaxID=554055 RepID=A0A2P6V3D6_9CHLO|nr:50S ribosomal L1 [Micractinium conductrix]|eukprot:PSC68592.1 50S ribosomal L1 [Micractinium conductrix]